MIPRWRDASLVQESSRNVRAAFDPDLDEPVPQHLREAVLALGTPAAGRKEGAAPQLAGLAQTPRLGHGPASAGRGLRVSARIALGWQLQERIRTRGRAEPRGERGPAARGTPRGLTVSRPGAVSSHR